MGASPGVGKALPATHVGRMPGADEPPRGTRAPDDVTAASMLVTNVPRLTGDETVREVARLLNENGYDSTETLFVVTGEGRLAGATNPADLLRSQLEVQV